MNAIEHLVRQTQAACPLFPRRRRGDRITPALAATILAELDAGLTYVEVKRKLSVSHVTIAKVKRQAGRLGPPGGTHAC